MVQIIYKETGTVVSEHSTRADAEIILAMFDTDGSKHEIVGEDDVAGE